VVFLQYLQPTIALLWAAPLTPGTANALGLQAGVSLWLGNAVQVLMVGCHYVCLCSKWRDQSLLTSIVLMFAG